MPPFNLIFHLRKVVSHGNTFPWISFRNLGHPASPGRAGVRRAVLPRAVSGVSAALSAAPNAVSGPEKNRPARLQHADRVLYPVYVDCGAGDPAF
ncbi:hypothetical protein KL918_002482 [Ogataea parapolymorpha]|nr:hypothetical protein KL918_002482 [Ogataea parapolymorpha]KAG7870675.1 hypothetical protein KL916_004723 [Ogataea parapolymorpha]